MGKNKGNSAVVPFCCSPRTAFSVTLESWYRCYGKNLTVMSEQLSHTGVYSFSELFFPLL